MGVILRRGPSHWVHLLRWDTREDRIERGAWHRGRVYEDGCDLSPDGTLFVYFATQYGHERNEGYTDAWTAVSRPPWLSGLALWPRQETWGSHAYFSDNATVVIDTPHWETLSHHPNHEPRGLTVLPRWIGNGAPAQTLPPKPPKRASFAGSEGVDHDGRGFWLIDGQLVRDPEGASPPLADFRLLTPHRTRSPRWAREW